MRWCRSVIACGFRCQFTSLWQISLWFDHPYSEPSSGKTHHKAKGQKKMSLAMPHITNLTPFQGSHANQVQVIIFRVPVVFLFLQKWILLKTGENRNFELQQTVVFTPCWSIDWPFTTTWYLIKKYTDRTKTFRGLFFPFVSFHYTVVFIKFSYSEC